MLNAPRYGLTNGRAGAGPAGDGSGRNAHYSTRGRDMGDMSRSRPPGGAGRKAPGAGGDAGYCFFLRFIAACGAFGTFLTSTKEAGTSPPGASGPFHRARERRTAALTASFGIPAPPR